jgi:hypothetical protein
MWSQPSQRAIAMTCLPDNGWPSAISVRDWVSS